MIIDLNQLLGQQLQEPVTDVPTDPEMKTVLRFSRLSGNDIEMIFQSRTEKYRQMHNMGYCNILRHNLNCITP